MLTLEKTLRASKVVGADLNCTDAWALVLMAHGMNDMVGHDHKHMSSIFLNDEAREKRGIPHLLSLVNKRLAVKLTAQQIEKAADESWDSALWSVWRSEKEDRSKVFLIGLEQHAYVEYEDKIDYGEGGVLATLHLSDHERFRQTKHYLGTERKTLFVAFFSSSVPTDSSAPFMGGGDAPIYPSYHFALAVTSEEYAELTSYLEQPIAFSIEINFT